MLRIGVIGCGYWGPNLVRVFSECEASRVTAVCDLDPGRIEHIIKKYPTIEGHADANELIARDDVDLVAVATPVDSHYRFTSRAISRGKHVLVEKPFTDNTADAEALVDQARRQGVLLAVDHTYLFTPAVEKIKQIMDAGEIGDINYIDSVRINLGLIQEEVNVIWDLAPHDLSIVDYVTGRTPRRVVATGSCHTLGGQADVGYINLDFGEGLIANFHVNWLSPVKVRRMIFGGDKKMLIFDDLSASEKIRLYDSGATPIANSSEAKGKRLRRVDYRIGDIWTPHIPLREALATEAAHLIDAIENATPLRVDGEAGLRVVRILEACDRSLLDDGGRVVLDGQPATARNRELAGVC